MAFFSTKRIGLTIQDNILLICEIITDDERDTEIRALNTVPIPPEIYQQGRILNAEKMRATIREGMKNAKPKSMKAGEIVFEIPEEHTFHHVFELPKSIPVDKAAEAVIFEAEKVLPFSIDQVSWDSKVIDYCEKSNLVLFSAAPLDLVQDYYNFFLSCGLQPLGFSIRVEDIISGLLKDNNRTAVIIDLQNEYTNAMFCIGKKIIDLQQISVGENELRKAIQEHYEIEPEKMEQQLNRLSLVDINLATIKHMHRFKEQLDVHLQEFLAKEKLFNRFHKPSKVFDEISEEKKSELAEGIAKTQEKEAEEKQKELEASFEAAYEASAEESSKKERLQRKKEKDKQEKNYSFIYTGNSIFNYALREFFKDNRDPHLNELEGNLKKMLNIKTKDYSVLHIFRFDELGQLDEKKKNGKNGKNEKKKESKESEEKTHSLFEKTIIQKLIPSAIGASLCNYSDDNPAKRPLNLLPKLVRAIALWKKTSAWFYLMATVMLIFSVVWLMAFGFQWGNTFAQLRNAQRNLILIERQFDTKKPLTLEEKIQNANTELQKISQLTAEELVYADIIKAIRLSLPITIQMNTLQYGLLADKSAFELRGEAPNRDEVIKAYNAIKSLPFIARVVFPASNFNERDSVDFSIQFMLKITTPATSQ